MGQVSHCTYVVQRGAANGGNSVCAAASVCYPADPMATRIQGGGGRFGVGMKNYVTWLGQGGLRSGSGLKIQSDQNSSSDESVLPSHPSDCLPIHRFFCVLFKLPAMKSGQSVHFDLNSSPVSVSMFITGACASAFLCLILTCVRTICKEKAMPSCSCWEKCRTLVGCLVCRESVCSSLWHGPDKVKILSPVNIIVVILSG